MVRFIRQIITEISSVYWSSWLSYEMESIVFLNNFRCSFTTEVVLFKDFLNLNSLPFMKTHYNLAPNKNCKLFPHNLSMV